MVGLGGRPAHLSIYGSAQVLQAAKSEQALRPDEGLSMARISLRPADARTSAAIAVALALASVVGCNPATFQTTLGTVGYDESIGITPTPDGGYAVCGLFGSPSPSFSMAKLDAQGTLVWQRSPSVRTGGLRGGCEAVTGGYLLVSSIQVPNDHHPYLWKVAPDGNELSAQALDTLGDEFVVAARPTGDDGFVLAGWYQDHTSLGVRVLLTQIDSAGTRLWSAPVDHAGNQRGQDVARLLSGDFVVVGSAGSSTSIDASPYLERVDAAGHTLWQKTLTDLGPGSLESVVERADGTILIGGFLRTVPQSGLLMAVAGDGSPIWTKTYPVGPTIVEDLVPLANGSVALAGTWSDGTGAANDAFLGEIDAAGTDHWMQHFGAALNEYAMDVSATADGGFVFVGGTESYGAGIVDLYVVKTDAAGQTGPPPG